MNNSSKFLGLALAIMFGASGIYACQPIANSNNIEGIKNQNLNLLSQKVSAQIKESLIMDSEDEKFLDDSETTLSNKNKSFATKSIISKEETDVKSNTNEIKADVTTTVNQDGKENIESKRVDEKKEAPDNKEIKNEIKELKNEVKSDRQILNSNNTEIKNEIKIKDAAFISKDGVISRDQEGTIKIDTEKLKETLKNEKEVIQSEVEKLKKKDNIVKVSNTEEIKNTDGSKIETGSVSFEDKSNNVKRSVVAIKNIDTTGKFTILNYSLTGEHKNFTRNVKRDISINTDGSKKISFYSLTTFKDGSKREVNKNISIDAQGVGSATGTIKIIYKNNSEKIFDINATISKTAGIITIAKDPKNGFEVKTEEKIDGTTLITTTEEGKSITEELTEENEAKFEFSESASGETHITSDTPTTSASPVTSATPTTSTSPVTSATPTTSTSPVTSATPTTSASPVTSATPTTSASPATSATPTSII